MNKRRLLSTASWSAMISVGGMAGAAMATPFSVNITQTPGVNVSQSGGNYNGQFDISAFLPPGVSVGAVSAVNAFVTAYGYSAADPHTGHQYTGYNYTSSYSHYFINYYYQASYTYYYTYYYSCGWAGLSTCSGTGSHTNYYYVPVYAQRTEYTYTRDHTQTAQDLVDDAMLLTVGGQSAQDDTDTVDNSHVYNGTSHVSYYNGYYSGITYRQDNYTDTDLMYGALEIQIALDSSNLADLDNDGVLDIEISALLGQFQIDSIILSAEFEEDVAVPAPGSAPIAAAVLAMLIAKRRRVRRESAKAAA